MKIFQNGITNKQLVESLVQAILSLSAEERGTGFIRTGRRRTDLLSLCKGDIVLVPFPFTDLTQSKLRPAVVLWTDPTGDNVTGCFISSQNTTNLSLGQFLLNPADTEFSGTKLKAASKVRVTRIASLRRQFIQRRLGQLGSNQIQQLNTAIIQAFQVA